MTGYDQAYLEKVREARRKMGRGKVAENPYVRMKRKSPLPMSSLVEAFVRDMRLTPGLNVRRVFAAWDAASGAGPFTLGRFFRSGKLYVTLSSSMVRSQLSFQKGAIMDRMNAILTEDNLFAKPSGRSVKYVTDIVLK